MKVILSRKGFDSANGGCPSPIFPSGTMVSMPIPAADQPGWTWQIGYDDLFCDVRTGQESLTYGELWSNLNKRQYCPGQPCHLDPDLQRVNGEVPVKNWMPAYGQCGGAETHLENQGVSVGDLFLFFGWFREVEPGKKRLLQYRPGSSQLQVIYGYLQVGEILRGEEIPRRYPWHPHAGPEFQKRWDNNTLYIPTKELIFDGRPTGLAGCGTFDYAEELVLTKTGMSRSRWKVFDWMKTTAISHHNAASIHDNYFQSAAIGQEFVVEGTNDVYAWVDQLFELRKRQLLEREAECQPVRVL